MLIFDDPTIAPLFATACGALGVWIGFKLKGDSQEQKPFFSETVAKCLWLTALDQDQPRKND